MANDDQPRGSEEQPDEFARTLKASARQVWLAGLGALARAQQEGGKLFDTLAQEGASLQERLDPQGKARWARARNSVAEMAAKASEGVEHLFDERVSKALDRLDVPLGKDVDALAARVEALERAVAALGSAKPPSRRRGPTAGSPAARDPGEPE